MYFYTPLTCVLFHFFLLLVLSVGICQIPRRPVFRTVVIFKSLFLCAFVLLTFAFIVQLICVFCLFYFSFAMVHCCVYLLCITILHELSFSLV